MGLKKHKGQSLEQLEQTLLEQEAAPEAGIQEQESAPHFAVLPEDRAIWEDDPDLQQDPGSYSFLRKCWGKLTRKKCSPGMTVNECEGMDLDRLTCRLRQAGFYNIHCYPSRDLSYRRRKLLHTVSGITIGGQGDFHRNTVFPFDAQIEIVYHAIKNVAVGFAPQDLRNTNAADTKAYFQHQGFGVVKTVPIRDLKMGWLKLDGQVERVLVDGFESFRPENEFPADCEITIYYHTFKSSH